MRAERWADASAALRVGRRGAWKVGLRAAGSAVWTVALMGSDWAWCWAARSAALKDVCLAVWWGCVMAVWLVDARAARSDRWAWLSGALKVAWSAAATDASWAAGSDGGWEKKQVETKVAWMVGLRGYVWAVTLAESKADGMVGDSVGRWGKGWVCWRREWGAALAGWTAGETVAQMACLPVGGSAVRSAVCSAASLAVSTAAARAGSMVVVLGI